MVQVHPGPPELALFRPDLVILLVASAVTGVIWAVFRLAVAYTNGPRPLDH